MVRICTHCFSTFGVSSTKLLLLLLRISFSPERIDELALLLEALLASLLILPRRFLVIRPQLIEDGGKSSCEGDLSVHPTAKNKKQQMFLVCVVCVQRVYKKR